MNKVVQLNTAETKLAIAKSENSIMKNISKNNDLVNDNMAKLDVKLDGFRNLVVALDETVSSLKIKVSKH